MPDNIHEISFRVHQLELSLAINPNADIRSRLSVLLNELIAIRKLNKSNDVKLLIDETIKLSDSINSSNGIDQQLIFSYLSAKINDSIWLIRLPTLPIPFPWKIIKDVEKPLKFIKQGKLPDCSLVSVVNASLFGKNKITNSITVTESPNEFSCIFNINGGEKVIRVANDLQNELMCDEYYGKVIEKCYFALMGYYTPHGDIELQSRNIIDNFKGSDFTDVAMLTLNYIPSPREMTLDLEEWKSIYEIWSSGNCIIGFGTSNFNDTKTITLSNGEKYKIIPNHDYPLTNLDSNGVFEILDGEKLVHLNLQDLVYFSILSINFKPPSLHQTYTFPVTGSSYIEFTTKLLERDSKSEYFIVLERHLPRTLQKFNISSESVSLYEVDEHHTGFLWNKEKFLATRNNMSRYTVLERCTLNAQICLDLKSNISTLYTLHLFSDKQMSLEKVNLDNYTKLKGRLNGKGGIGSISYNENPIVYFKIPSMLQSYVVLNIGAIVNENENINFSIYDDRGINLSSTKYQKCKQFKLLTLQTNQKYKLILSSLNKSFAKFKIVSDRDIKILTP